MIDNLPAAQPFAGYRLNPPARGLDRDTLARCCRSFPTIAEAGVTATRRRRGSPSAPRQRRERDHRPAQCPAVDNFLKSEDGTARLRKLRRRACRRIA